jgi:TonB family protein
MIAILALSLVLQTAAAPPQTTVTTTQDEPLTLPPIAYPAEAKARRIEGTVHLQIAVDAQGHVFGVKVIDGPPMLQQAASEAYRHATYKPLLKDGKPTPAIVNTSVDFHLTVPPPDTDQVVAREFDPLHSNCQKLSSDRNPDAILTCRRAVEVARRFTPGAELEARVTALNDLVLLLTANGKYDGLGPNGKPSARPNHLLPEAGELAEQAVDLVAGAPRTSPAVALAYITRAEVRSLAGDLKGSAADCTEAEEALKTTLQGHGTDDPENERAGRFRVQLRETLLLHAIVLDRQGKHAQAKRLRLDAEQY